MNTSHQGKVVLITGASSGIGKAIAKLLLKNNFIVYCAARSFNNMTDLAAIGGKCVSLDVTDDLSVANCIDVILDDQKKIDILVNNAGYGSYGALENVSINEAKKQLEVNLFGLARLTQQILPSMRKQKQGKIINISSIAGKISSPMGSWYFASKHAVEGLSDSLRQELKPFGIDVIIIEPGGIKSNWANIAAQHLVTSSKNTAYEFMANQVVKNFPFVDKINDYPEVIAEIVLKAVQSKHPKTRYVKGTHAKSLLFLRKLLPDKLFDKAVLSQLKIN